MLRTRSIVRLAATVAAEVALSLAIGAPSAAAAPVVHGAAVQPSTIVRVHKGSPVDVSVCSTAKGRPSDVSVIRADGRQYRTTRNGRAWTHRGHIVARRQGHIVVTTRTAYVATWCER